jgi:hypothetical protein
MNKNKIPLKQRFIDAVNCGKLGTLDEFGVVVTVKEFKIYFSDIKTDYTRSFLPAATIEQGQTSTTHTKYLFNICKGVYRVHPDALNKPPARTLRTNNKFLIGHSAYRL